MARDPREDGRRKGKSGCADEAKTRREFMPQVFMPQVTPGLLNTNEPGENDRGDEKQPPATTKLLRNGKKNRWQAETNQYNGDRTIKRDKKRNHSRFHLQSANSGAISKNKEYNAQKCASADFIS